MLAVHEEKRMSGLIGGNLSDKAGYVCTVCSPPDITTSLSIFNCQHLINTPNAAPTKEIGTAACLSHMRQGADAHTGASSAAATTRAFHHTRDSYLYINANTSGSSG